MTGRGGSFIAVKEDEAGGGNVQGESKEGRHEKEGGKGRKLQGIGNIQGGQ